MLTDGVPNGVTQGNATTTDGGLEALRSKRDTCRKAENPDLTEIKKNNRAMRDLEKKASKKAKLKRSTEEAVTLATKGADKASKAKGKAAK
ncbi:hypothetical protein MGU_07303 [Metarhizium guizhouense ARSEF 977]|uniref:Uncharacterized protein n=1 Tax=Metarhizium guizhouense (strain ARSEF 977) TaxID=1276136 RepID=A0A0B4H6P6_METGA|nr:hypothetical protein MGU_07303 [Metarhizium guizhouense ARSEF 977]